MACDFAALSHAGIQSLSPYVPGKPIEELARELGISDIIKLASNENPLGCSPKAQEALQRLSIQQIANYPSSAIHPMREKLSAKLDVEPAMLCLSNGSDLLFGLLLKLFCLHTGKHALTHDLAFITYQIQAQELGIPIRFSPINEHWDVDIQAMIAMCNKDTGIIFIANPNNPTGKFIPHNEIVQLLNNVPATTIVVIDEAYYEFAYPEGDTSTIELLAQFPNLVITRTFSKIYGLAGLRLGYAIAHPQIVELILRLQLPFSVNQAVLEAGYAALDDQAFIAKTLANNTAGMQQMVAGLIKADCHVIPSHCNFVTFSCRLAGAVIYKHLLSHGIIIRPLAGYGLPDFLRVSIGKLEQNARFLDKLSFCLSEYSEE
ncbi:histidinol-phosphate transaminase [Legionella dresdenensis]|uniref:Histidinol-phosphate aminotransferase n=1 Tax=Legionella dresdenensis TaxID=450200 RepID=A0ABV8CCJ4_9GAMM